MAESKYTAPNDFRAFCEALGETEASMCHHGVKGMHWGERKYQDYNGRLTAAGRIHYGYGPGRKGKHSDTGENENAQDDSDRKIAEIAKNYEFNKEYTLRDPLVKKAISVAKEWDAGRSNDLHSGEEENRYNSVKNIGKAAAVGAGIGTASGAIRTAREVSAASDVAKFINDNFSQYGVSASIDPASVIATFGYHGIIRAGVGAGVGAAAAGIAHLAAASQAKHANAKLSDTIKEIGQNQNIDKKTGLKLKNTQMSADDDMAKVNPGFKNWSDGTKSNCLICTATYALRRKGFDVTANGANDGYDTTAMLQAFPKATMRRVQLPKTNKNNELASSLNMPEGAFGNMSVNWKNGGGHSMVISVEGGRVVIRDTQSNKTYRGAAVNKILARTTGEAKVIRLDNADPDIAQMKKMGMINPLGQSFKVDPKAVTQGVAGAAKKAGKHGDAGFLSDLVSTGLGKLDAYKDARETAQDKARQEINIVKLHREANDINKQLAKATISGDKAEEDRLWDDFNKKLDEYNTAQENYKRTHGWGYNKYKRDSWDW